MLNIEPTFFYTAILIGVCLSLLLIGVTYLYITSVKKYLSLRDEKKRESANVDSVTAQRIQEAEGKAQAIINDSQSKAQSMLSNIQNLTNSINDEIQKELSKATELYAKSYGELLSSSKLETAKMVQNISKSINDAVLEEVRKMAELLRADLANSENEAKRVVVESYKKMEEQVRIYEQQRIKQIEDSMFLVVNDILGKALFKKIGKKEHDELVIKALEEAKKQNLFQNNESQGNIDDEVVKIIPEEDKKEQKPET